MSNAAALERGYRRWLRWYPGTFRREHESEILAVLMAGAREGQRRPQPAECLDLICSALSMHLRPRVARSNGSVLNAIKLLYLGAAVELAAAITIWASAADVKANVVMNNPSLTAGQWRSVVESQIAPNEVGAILAVGFWLWMAWAVGRGHQWPRIALTLFFALNLCGLVTGLVLGSAVYARPDLGVAIVLCLVELGSIAVIFRAKIGPGKSDINRIAPES